MKKSELITNIKEEFWWLKLNYPISFWRNKVDDALRKFTINSGMTKWIKKSTASFLITFTPSDKIYYVVNVFPYDDGASMSSNFNVFNPSFLYAPWGTYEHSPDIEFISLSKSFLDTLKSNYGQGMDFYYDQDTLILSLNSNSKYSSLIISYLPVWSLDEEDLETINDLFVLDWIEDYCAKMVEYDIWKILQTGAAFDLPAGSDGFDGAKEEMGEMEQQLRAKFPLLGMSVR